jgi:hypothetical protein
MTIGTYRETLSADSHFRFLADYLSRFSRRRVYTSSISKQLLYIKGQLKPFGNRCRCEWARCPNRLIQTLHFIAYIREDFQKVSTEGLFKYRCRRPWRGRIWKFVPDIVHVICTKSAARSASNLQIGIGPFFFFSIAHIIFPAGSRRL